MPIPQIPKEVQKFLGHAGYHRRFIQMYSEIAQPLSRLTNSQNPQAWSSSICTCCNDMRSCCLGLWCPCILFTRNAEVLEGRPWTDPCLMHAWLWSVAAGVGCSVTHGTLFGFPISCIPCYAYGYRKILRSKHNLEDASFDDDFLSLLLKVFQAQERLISTSLRHPIMPIMERS
ncbi:hypothetical protein KP509_37G038000 [Ceratopteris richardii]|uniref:Uncharacterized protein n=1 Tax=Ceratopteris richardii TaxID=49495 RepID=A0A8T2Q7P6_CERRI|nr:hypothetical protein KP509_37G038000 [Ceratopteris richardii]